MGKWLWDKIRSNYLWLALILIAIAAIFVFWLMPFNPPPDDKPDRYYYLLSALSQGLAAVLAIVFTLSLVAAQLSTRYTQRIMGQFFDKWTLLLMLLFLAATLMPLFLLPAIDRIDAALVKSSLLLGAISLTLLIPYLWILKQKLSPEYFLADLEKKAKGVLLSRKEHSGKFRRRFEDLPDEVSAIDNIALSTYAQRDYDTFGLAVSHLAALIGIDINDENRLNIYQRLKNIAFSVKEDPRAFAIVVKGFGKAGHQLLEIGLFETGDWIFPIHPQIHKDIVQLGEDALNWSFEEAAIEVCKQLSDICGDTPRDEEDICDRIWKSVINLGIKACNLKMETVSNRTALKLDFLLMTIDSKYGDDNFPLPFFCLYPFVEFGIAAAKGGLKVTLIIICGELEGNFSTGSEARRAARCKEMAYGLCVIGAVCLKYAKPLLSYVCESLAELEDKSAADIINSGYHYAQFYGFTLEANGGEFKDEYSKNDMDDFWKSYEDFKRNRNKK